MFVTHRFQLNDYAQDRIQGMIPEFGYDNFGELVYYRTYSRVKENGKQESWHDTVIRVINGCMSIRKDFYLKNKISWKESFWQSYAEEMAVSLFNLEWSPGGRGLWAMGSDFVYQRGSMALYNCAYVRLENKTLAECIGWLMDSLMHGVGVGFSTPRDKIKLFNPFGEVDFIIPDSREGWVESVEKLIDAHTRPNQRMPRFIYDHIRGPGLPIRGFGGISSGPEPLMKLHEQIKAQFENFKDIVLLKGNLANLTGTCVVAGNVRRSAELWSGSVHDPIFLDAKNYEINPDRAEFGWMSNNSAGMETEEDFDELGEIANRVLTKGEPGIINKINVRYGRIGKKMRKYGLRKDKAEAPNPCGEIFLEDREVCNLGETMPTRGHNWMKACEYITTYCTTVSLLPTHQPSTNRVVARNRRIGVGIIDFTGWKHENGVHKVTKWMREGYDLIVKTGQRLNEEAGVPAPIRYTCVKPGGTVPKLAGRTPGIGHPTFHYTLRTIRIQQGTIFHTLLADAGIPFHEDGDSQNTDVFEYPILQGPSKPAEEVSLWEAANNLVLMQREWADNAVSNTLYFKPKWVLEWVETENIERTIMDYVSGVDYTQIKNLRLKEFIILDKFKLTFDWNGLVITQVKIYEFNPKHEEDDVEAVLSSIVPLIKSVSLIPHTAKGVYKDMPEQKISKEEYERRKAAIKSINWSQLSDSDGMDDKYCSGEQCEIIPG